MPAASTAAPLAILGVGAGIAWLLRRGGGGRPVAAVAAWLALALVVGLHVSLGPQEQGLGTLGAGIEAGLRRDNLAFTFSLLILAPGAAILTFRTAGGGAAALGVLAVAAAVTAVESSSLLLTAVALGTATTLVRVLFGFEGRGWGQWPWFLAGSVVLAWAGTLLQDAGGTSSYGAVAVGSLPGPALALLALVAVMASGLVPWRPWTSVDGERFTGLAGPLAVAAVAPIGFYLLLRALDLGGGRFPSPPLQGLTVGLGVAVAAGAALRGQAASSREEYLAEVVPGMAGVALAALGCGGTVGLAAGVTTLLGAGLLAALVPLVPAGDARWFLGAVVVAAGVPPALTFGARLMSLQALLELGEPGAALVLVAAGTWILVLAGAARALQLESRAAGGSAPGAGLTVACCLGAGAAVGLAQAAIALPLAADLLEAPRAQLGSGGAVVTPSGGWPALAVGAPLLVLAAGLAVASWRAPAEAWIRRGPAPQPLMALAGRDLPARVWRRLSALRVPASAGIPSGAALENALESGGALLWLAMFGALTYVLLR